jgi:hypothetical protein
MTHYVGRPCPACGTTTRYVSGDKCVRCDNMRERPHRRQGHAESLARAKAATKDYRADRALLARVGRQMPNRIGELKGEALQAHMRAVRKAELKRAARARHYAAKAGLTVEDYLKRRLKRGKEIAAEKARPKRPYTWHTAHKNKRLRITVVQAGAVTVLAF